MNDVALDLGILAPAFVAGLLVLVTHVPLGIQVLARGIVFIDLAIAQIAGIGVIGADALGLDAETGGWAVQAAAVLAALGGALLLTWTERRWPQVQEALIGVLFVLASCVGILMLARNPHGGEHLKDLLVGQILWVSWQHVAWLAGLTVVLAPLAWRLQRALGEGPVAAPVATGPAAVQAAPPPHAPSLPVRLGFYAVFALAVTASVQLVGVYLVFASLILPALATRGLPAHRVTQRLAWAWGTGGLAYATGLALSAQLDLPSGAVIVLVMAALAAAVAAGIAALAGA
jgi:zinc/manganese transport system permease protein